MGRGDAGSSARAATELKQFELYFPAHNAQYRHVLYPANQLRDGSWDLAGYLIGPRGQTLQGVRETAGAYLQVEGGPDSPNPRQFSPNDNKLRIVIRAASLKAVQKAADECAKLLKPENYKFKDVAVRDGGKVRLEPLPVTKPGGASIPASGRVSTAPSSSTTGSSGCGRAPTATKPNAWGHPVTPHTVTDRDTSTTQEPYFRPPPGAQFQAAAPRPPATPWKTQASAVQIPKSPSPRPTPAVASSWLKKAALASPSDPAMKRADPPGPGPWNSRPSTPPAWSPSPTATAAAGPPRCSESTVGGSNLSSPQVPGTPEQASPADSATTSAKGSKGGRGRTTKSEVPDAKGVPRTPALCKVLGLRNDIFLAQRGELVRKALDEAALGLHWHVAYTLIHSAANPYCNNAAFLEVFEPLELDFVDGPDHEKVILKTRKLDGVTRTSSAEEAVRSGEIWDLMQWLYGYRDHACIWTRDLRTLLQHVKKAIRPAYYQDSAWEHANRLLELMTASTHRSAIAVPADLHDGARLPSPEEVERLYGGNDAINARDARCIEETFKALHGLADSIKLLGSLDQLPDGSIYRAACEDIAGAAEKHLKGATRIYDRYKILHGDAHKTQEHTSRSNPGELQTSLRMLESALQTAPQQPRQQPLRGAIGSNGSSCSKIDGGKAKKKKNKSASPEVQFVLLSLWSRYGTNGEKERKPPADEGFQKVSSSRNSEDRTQHLRAATVQKSLLNNINRKGGLYDEKGRLRILNPDANSFKTDPFGITNQDVALRALDLAVRGLRRALIACSRVHGPSTGQADPDSAIRRTRSRLLTEVNAVGRDQGMKGSCSPLKMAGASGGHNRRNGKGIRNADAAVIYKPAECSPGSETLMHDFATRHNLKANSDWKKRQTEAFLTFDPHWGDPRFLSEFLRNLHQSHDDIFPGFAEKLTQLLGLRDKVAHQVHTINLHIVELQTDTVRQSIQDMIDLVMGLQALTEGTPQDGPAEELVALRELSSTFDGYQRWRNRQHGALKINAVDMLPRAYATVHGLLALVDDPQAGRLAQHQDDNLTALGCQNAEALLDLLNIYTRIAHPK